MTAILIVDPGVQSLIQDGGRPGLAHLGIAHSGAYDLPALALANALVGNRPTAPGIETLLGGLRICAEDGPVVVGISTDVIPIQLAAGETLRIPRSPRPLRSYVAIGGGLQIDEQLGSCSTDIMSGIGPKPLQAGDRMLIRNTAPVSSTVLACNTAADSVARAHTNKPTDNETLRVYRGPEIDLIALDLSTPLAFTVSAHSDRRGLRLTGGPTKTNSPAHHPSQPTRFGAVQLLPNGDLLVLGPDGPTTGGYPIVAVVVDEDLPHLGQLVPGSAVSLRFENPLL